MLGYIFLTSLNQEREDWYGVNWIPSGLYYDLIDNVNLQTEVWDNVGGSNIHNMYSVFNPYSTSMCFYYQQFVGTYPVFNNQATYDLFAHYPNIICY
jgi:hypothetical protein